MRQSALFVVVLLCAVAASAATISSISPTTVEVSSAEHFLTVNGSDLGSQVIFDGPAGTFTVNVNYANSSVSRVIVWIPQEVVNRSGSYSVTTRGSNGLSNAATLTVTGGLRRFVLLVPDALLVSAISRDVTTVKYNVDTFSPTRDPEPPKVDCFPASGDKFKFGTTKVDCTAVNYYGERDTASFTINVIDDGAPVVKVPADIVTEQSQEGGAVVKFDAAAFDAIDGDLRVSCDRSSGTLFRVGKTRVTCTAMDYSLNQGGASFMVEVKGRATLALEVPTNFVAEADSVEGSRVFYEVLPYGTDDPEPKIKCDPAPNSLFRIGTTTVDCYAEDRFGQSAKASFDVNVVDSMGPVIANLYTKPEYLVPVDGSMISVAVTADPRDVVDPSPRCTITGITANEAITTDDYKIVSDREVVLRARVSGKTDRIYGIAVTCTDANRNETSGFATVVVPVSGEAPKSGSLAVAGGNK